MSKKIRVFAVEDTNRAINVLRFFGSRTFNEIITGKQLVILRSEGLYFLIPRETMLESSVLHGYQNTASNNYNLSPCISISIGQCIPIPSETAKILLEL